MRSYRTFSPLPVLGPAVCSLWHFPASRLDWPLASTLPCGVPTFLDPPERTAAIQPAPRHRSKASGLSTNLRARGAQESR